ncbi:MAG: hypothetical protein OQK50_03420 [Deltaproteobacteria bacterium]|nr:hypothetical protein [Deltaproteobacteria bacterium]MCW9049364.1 hypothetical protein [Deltaproteobacteria bacterium]
MARITDRALSTKAKEKDIWIYAPNKEHGELYVRVTPGSSCRFYFRCVGAG